MEGRQGGNTCRGGMQDSGVQEEVGEGGAGGGVEEVKEVKEVREVKADENDCQSEEASDECLSAIQRLSIEVSEAQNSDQAGLRKGLSVPDVGLEDIQDRVSYNSENSKSHKLGFLRHLGLKRSKTEGTTDPSGKKRLKSLRKTLSSLFHLRSKLDGDATEDTQEAKPRRPTSAPSIFRLPTRKPKNVPPCQRALPPVPGITAPSSSPPEAGALSLSTVALDSDQTTSTHDTTRADAEGENIDFAASIEKVKDVSSLILSKQFYKYYSLSAWLVLGSPVW